MDDWKENKNMKIQIDGWMDRKIDGWLDRWKKKQMNGLMDIKQCLKKIDGWLDGQEKNRRMVGGIEAWMAEWIEKKN